MNQKSITRVCMLVGAAVGGYVPLLWGGDLLSMSSIVLTAVGAIAGIYAGFKIGRM